MYMPKKTLATLIVILLCSGCGRNIRDNLGLESSAPDEFKVMAHKELTIPENFDNLPKPQDSISYTEEPPKSKLKAKQAILGKNDIYAKEEHNDNDNNYEDILLGNIDLPSDSEYIREQIDRENQEYKESLSIIENERKDPIVDAQKEQERIRNNLKNNKKLNEGGIAERERKSSLVDLVF